MRSPSGGVLFVSNSSITIGSDHVRVVTPRQLAVAGEANR